MSSLQLHEVTFARWQQLWASIGVRSTDATLFQKLCAAWSEPHRHYHTIQHLHECLSLFDLLRHQALHPQEIEMALWFHDAVYDVHCSDNEIRSAEWACSTMQTAGVTSDVIARVNALILSTSHNAIPTTRDQQLILDIDLAILGAIPERFAEYSAQIRSEYSWVPELLYSQTRFAILAQFMSRPRIFHTDQFFLRFENQARINLAFAIAHQS